MRVFVAGATGAIGRQLVPRLVAAGHEVHGMTRTESKQAMLYELGAVPVVADALDPDQVADAVGKARPDVIVHQLTALAKVTWGRRVERVLLALHRPTGARVKGDALRHEPPHPHRLSGRQQVVRPLDPGYRAALRRLLRARHRDGSWRGHV